MASGRLGAFDLLENIPQSIYVCPTDDLASATVNVVNRRNDYANVTLAITDDPNTIADTDAYLEIEVPIPPKGVMERSQVMVPSGKYLTVKSDKKFVNVTAWGATVGNPLDPLPDSIPTNATNYVYDGDFAKGNFNFYTTNLSGSGFAQITNGEAYIQDLLAGSDFNQTIDVQGEKLYRYRFTVSEVAGTSALVRLSQNTGTDTIININAPGTYTGEFITDTNTAYIVWWVEVVSASVSIDNLELWEASTSISLVHERTIEAPGVFDTVPGEADDFGRYQLKTAGNYSLISAGYERVTPSAVGVNYSIENSTGSVIQAHRPVDTARGFSNGRIALNNSYGVMGSPQEDTFGLVYIIDPQSGATLRTISNPNPDNTGGDNFGNSGIDISGKTVMVGATGEDVDGADFGRVYFFNAEDGSTTKTLINPRPTEVTNFGRIGSKMSNKYYAVQSVLRGGVVTEVNGVPGTIGTPPTALRYEFDIGAGLGIHNYVSGGYIEGVDGLYNLNGDRGNISAATYNNSSGILSVDVSTSDNPPVNTPNDRFMVWGIEWDSGDILPTGNGWAVDVTVYDQSTDQQIYNYIVQGPNINFDLTDKYLAVAVGINAQTVVLVDLETQTQIYTLANDAQTIAIAGNYLLLGRSSANWTGSGTTNNEGFIEVRNISDGSIVQTLYPPVPATFGEYGSALSIDKDYLLVGNLNSVDIYKVSGL